jgi:chemotaxis methyl-accepting protein methylase
VVAPEVRAMVALERRDLLNEAPPATGFHLIACRNVLIYFDRATQEALFSRFHDALLPGGFLVLGKVETLLGVARGMFTAVDARERIFRRA